MIYKFEIWEEIYNGDYKVSNFGRIKRNKSGVNTYIGRILKPFRNPKGYPQIKLYGKTIVLHRLIARVFIGRCPKGKQVNHKNPDKFDADFSCAWNLEYVTPKQNMEHAVENNLMNRKGEKNGKSILTEKDVLNIRKMGSNKKYTLVNIAKEYNVSDRTIGSIMNKRIWNHI